MSEHWTKDQFLAIKTQVPELFISASAGSGKTSTMVARIMELVKKGSANVGELLVLTFTNESARDMREKLARGFERAVTVADNKTTRENLIKQLLDLPSSDIGTFHSFCGNIVRQWWNIAGVNPNFSIIDDAECGKIKAEIFEKLIIDCYDGTAKVTIDRFAVNRNFNNLRETILSLHSFLESREDREKWLNEIATQSYNADIDNNNTIKNLIEHYKTLAGWYRDKFV
ncbi:MAG: UvrD-helicase domain-containing protein, partial [Christensenellaceae bacterium]|nr:UvrD-helicase domain-containing protein [Christensenellaceae bacterium]